MVHFSYVLSIELKRIFDCWSQTKARHEEDISVTLDLCHNQALDGNHYDEESHTCKFK